MKHDFKVFLEVFSETLDYFLGIDFNGWWMALAEKGTDKIYLTALIVILLGIGAAGFFHWSFRFVAYFILVGYMGVILVAGETPSMALMTLAILYITVTLAFGTAKKLKIAAGSGLAVLILCGVLLVFSNFVGVPVLKTAFGDVIPLRTKIQNTSLVHVINEFLPDELKFQDGTGEYEGGSLETQDDGPDFTGRTVHSVESDTMPTSPVYLARYEGNVYTGYSFDASGNLDNPGNRASIRYPKDVLANLEAFCLENPVEGGAAEIRDFILKTLHERTEYSISVEPLPEGKDFIEHFFFESQEGYCIHYAATAVMMFRMYGIPAKYVTGFLIPPSMFYLNEDGVYQADIPDVQAHAWVEICVDGKWIPIEVTPSGGIPLETETEGLSENGGTEGNTEGGTEEGTTEAASVESSTEFLGTSETEMAPTGTEAVPAPETESETGTEKGSESESETTSESETAAEQNTETSTVDLLGNGGPSWIFLPVILLLALVLIVAGLFIRRLIVLDRRRKENVQAMYADLYEVMLQNGLPMEVSLLSDDFTEQVLTTFPWIDPKEWAAVLKIVLDATYGPGRAADEEWIVVQRMYYTVCRQIGKNLKGMSKIAFYLVDVWI